MVRFHLESSNFQLRSISQIKRPGEVLLSKPYLYLQVPAVSKRKIVFKGTCFSQTFSGHFNTIPIEPDVAALPQSYFLEDIDTDQCDLFSEATASLEGPVRTQESESDG